MLMNIFVLLYNSGTDKEGIHSIELKGRTIVLMFEDKDDATRYCGLLEAQDFPLPTVEMINIEEIKDFCIKLDYEYKLVEKNFVPKTAEDRLLISPPQFSSSRFFCGGDISNLSSADFGTKFFSTNLYS